MYSDYTSYRFETIEDAPVAFEYSPTNYSGYSVDYDINVCTQPQQSYSSALDELRSSDNMGQFERSMHPVVDSDDSSNNQDDDEMSFRIAVPNGEELGFLQLSQRICRDDDSSKGSLSYSSSDSVNSVIQNTIVTPAKQSKGHKCSHCSKTFNRRESLISHRRLHHKWNNQNNINDNNNNMAVQSSSPSPLSLLTQATIAQLLSNHHKELYHQSNQHQLSQRSHQHPHKPFQCRCCKKQFRRKESMETHIKTHSM